MIDKKITASELKLLNKNRIYKLIYEKEEMSRQEIAAKLSLSLPTINQNLKELEEQGLICYRGSFESTGGRKAQAIIPVKDAWLTIGIDIRKSYVRILIIDLYGNVVDYEKYLKTFSVSDEYNRYLGYLVQNIIKHNNLANERILGVGISLPAVFDQTGATVLKAPSLDADGFSVLELARYIQYPIVIDNDANGGAFTEFWNNANHDKRVYLSVEKGVGGCFIDSDGLYKGRHKRAGEFGHMTMVPKGRLCNCGQMGCLESYISTARISEDLDCQIEDFFVGLESGNPEYTKIWDKYLEYLCLGINNIFTIYDSKIILGGMLTQYLEPYIEDIRLRLKALNSFESDTDYLTITKYQSKASSIGVALQLVKRFIDTV